MVRSSGGLGPSRRWHSVAASWSVMGGALGTDESVGMGALGYFVEWVATS